jgi:hypothetical protein
MYLNLTSTAGTTMKGVRGRGCLAAVHDTVEISDTDI